MPSRFISVICFQAEKPAKKKITPDLRVIARCTIKSLRFVTMTTLHTSTPQRSVELRMKKESRDLVASAGHLSTTYLKYGHHGSLSQPLGTESARRLGTKHGIKRCRHAFIYSIYCRNCMKV